ncbi:MAG: M67 family metallopeptidase [Magnetococcales bacterium]|nr:M67 family metallopeptidase [Magnetococcales bacterium]
MIERLLLPRGVIHGLLGHAQRSAPLECVGVLSGRGGRVEGWHPLSNVLADERRFLADPAEQLALFRRLREEGREVLAIYHSHPRAGEGLSERDLREAAPEGPPLHVVISLGTEGRMVLAAWRLTAAGVEALEVEMGE